MKKQISRAIAMALVAGGLTSAASAQTLSTLYATGNNGSAGGIIFFDLVVGPSPITISSVDCNLGVQAAATYGFTMYTKNGTYLGSEQNAAAWTVATTGTIAGTGVTNTPSPATFGSAVVLAANTTYGVGLVLAATGQTSASHYYTNGNGTNQTYSNADLTINLGAAQNVPFTGAPFTPRVWNGTVHYTLGGTTGACCLGAPSYSCVVTTSAGCAGAGGTYAGDNITCAAANCPPPPTGACCNSATGCSVTTQLACTTAGGVYGGNNVACGVTPCPITAWLETGDAGDTPGTAQDTVGSGTLLQIRGNTTGTGDADVYKIKICDEANFLATTVGGTTLDTQLFLFDSNGFGLVMDDDDVGASGTLQSRITTQFVTANGSYYLAVSGYDSDPMDSAAAYIWGDQNATPAYGPEWAPNGPAAANAWASFDHISGAAGSYSIALTGACFNTPAAVSCYANCDASTSTPLLTANDFQCFLNKYASGDSYANCDGSTATPVLTANDFQCFLNSYAAGCS